MKLTTKKMSEFLKFESFYCFYIPKNVFICINDARLSIDKVKKHLQF